MNFGEVVAEVIRMTKRPDKAIEAAFQVNRAISFYTLKADFSKDLVEDTIVADPLLYGQVIDLTTLLNFRKIKYLRPTNQRYYLKEIGADKLLTPGGQIQPNRYFIGGTSLTVTLSVLTPTLEIGYYTYAPVLTEAPGFNTHWMLDLMPYAIIEKAAAKVFQSAGDDASAKTYEASAAEFFIAARADFEDQTSNSSY